MGNSVLARAKAHFGLRRSIAIPEWPDEDGKPTVIYWSPFTIDEQNKLRAMRDAGNDDAVDGMLRVLITKAQGENGVRLFDIGDRPEMRNSVDALVLDRIIEALMSTDTVEQAEKN